MKLYVAAISRLLVSKGVITVGEVASFVDAVDSDDGRKNGRFNGRLA
jgi:hypothetical protein